MSCHPLSPGLAPLTVLSPPLSAGLAPLTILSPPVSWSGAPDCPVCQYFIGSKDKNFIVLCLAAGVFYTPPISFLLRSCKIYIIFPLHGSTRTYSGGRGRGHPGRSVNSQTSIKRYSKESINVSYIGIYIQRNYPE